MLCEQCQKRDAVVHLSGTSQILPGGEPLALQEHHFCEPCANEYYKTQFGAPRNLLCLSDWFRERLYDIMEESHPEAFYDGEDEAEVIKAAVAMETVLRDELQKEGISVNEDVFAMLATDLIGSHRYYSRREAWNKKKEE